MEVIDWILWAIGTLFVIYATRKWEENDRIALVVGIILIAIGLRS